MNNKTMLVLTLVMFVSCHQQGQNSNDKATDQSLMASADSSITQIAQEAYIYGYPMVDNYKVMYSYFIDKSNPEYNSPFNVLNMDARVFTPEDKVVQTPNSDTPYGKVGFDLRGEPFVLHVPAVDSNRYYSVQLIDLYTHNFDYLGTRTSGNKGGNYLITGPGWQGVKPAGIDRIIQSETDFALAVFRIQLFSPSDIGNVKRIQEKFSIKPLSKFIHSNPGNPAPAIAFPPFEKQKAGSIEFFGYLNFLLQFCPVHPSEIELRQRFAKIGVEPGNPFTPDSAHLKAIENGIAAGKAQMEEAYNSKDLSSQTRFGTREVLKNNYLNRAMGAKLGIYGNSKEEAMYPAYKTDADGNPLDGSKHNYFLKFEKNMLPPVHAFWSLTMYRLPEQLLTDNPIKRYLINSSMLPQLKEDADGGFTLYIQKDSPGKSKENNWLPAPDGTFFAVMRLYWPKEEAINGIWKQPSIQKAK